MTERYRKSKGNLVFDSAIAQNRLHQVKWAIANGFKLNCNPLLHCLDEKEWKLRNEILIYLLDKNPGDIDEIIVYALKQASTVGDLDFVQWVVSDHISEVDQPKSIFEDAVQCASKKGHLDVVKWLVTYNGEHFYPSGAMIDAAENGKTAVVKWLFHRFSHSSKKRHLFEHHSSISDDEIVMNVAAGNDHLDVLKYIHDADAAAREKGKCTKSSCGYHQNLRCTVEAMDGAAANGRLEVVKWLHSHRSEGCTTNAMNYVAANGHLEVVQWLHDNRLEGCSSRIMDMTAAIRFSRRDTYNSDCPEAKRLFNAKQLATLQWLHSNRLNSVNWVSNAMNAAAANGNLEMLIWLHVNTDIECTPTGMNDAATNGHLEIMKWLYQNCSVKVTSATMDDAAFNGHLEVVKWLSSTCPEVDTSKMLKRAATGGQLHIVQWLLRYGKIQDRDALAVGTFAGIRCFPNLLELRICTA